MTMTIAQTNPAQLRAARANNPKMRERELAKIHSATEGELVAAFVGHGNTRINVDLPGFLPRVAELGKVLALTRNEAAVHEKIGTYNNVSTGKGAMLVLDANIDLRIFPTHWKHGFAVVSGEGDAIKRSFQFFDAKGEAVHKIHLKPESDLAAFETLIADFRSQNQSDEFGPLEAAVVAVDRPDEEIDVDMLKAKWEGMTDTHQLFGILKTLGVGRHQVLRLVDSEKAWRLENAAIETLLMKASEVGVPLMCFIGSAGCIQIHSGPISAVKTMGPWINIMDETFHMHLRMDLIHTLWGVRKPVETGYVTSVEAFDADGNMIVQFFGKRVEGQDERTAWREIVNSLSPLANSIAA
jgi:putative hemin transport protein